MSCTRLKVGVLTGPPKESMDPNPASSMRTRRTLGASSGAPGPGMNDHPATESLSVRPAVPPKALSGIGSTVRSGLNLPAASASASFSPRRPCLSIGATDLAGEPVSARSASSRCSSSTIATIAAVPGLNFSPRPSSSPLPTLCRANLPTRPPAAAPTAIEASSGGAARPTSTPTPPPQPMPLRPRWSPVWDTRTLPLSSCSTRMRPSLLTFLCWTSRTSPSKSFWADSVAGYAAMMTENASLTGPSLALAMGSPTGRRAWARPSYQTVTAMSPGLL